MPLQSSQIDDRTNNFLLRFHRAPGSKTRMMSLLTMRSKAPTLLQYEVKPAFKKEVKQNSRPGDSRYVRVAQPRLPTTGSNNRLLPTRSNNIYQPRDPCRIHIDLDCPLIRK